VVIRCPQHPQRQPRLCVASLAEQAGAELGESKMQSALRLAQGPEKAKCKMIRKILYI